MTAPARTSNSIDPSLDQLCRCKPPRCHGDRSRATQRMARVRRRMRFVGIAVSMGRMDDVPPSVVDFATDKAFTAAMSRKSTHAFFERMSSSTALSMGLSEPASPDHLGGRLANR